MKSVLFSVMSNSANSFRNNTTMENKRRHHVLVKGLLRYILLDYYPAINWKPNGIFDEVSADSPLNVVIKWAIKLYLDSNGAEIHSHYDEDFPRKDDINDAEHFDILVYLKGVFESKPFNCASFLDYLCMCGEYTALSYLYGADRAPHLTLQVICVMMQQMRESGQITEDFWIDFGEYCERYVQAERPRSMKKFN